MWREAPKPLRDVDRAVTVMFGIFICQFALRLIGEGLDLPFRMWLYVPCALGTLVVGSLFGVRAILAARIMSVHARGGHPRFAVHATFAREDKPYARDQGVVTFEGGCLLFEGIECRFSIPRDRALWPDQRGSAIGVMVDGKAIWIAISNPRRLDNPQDANDLAHFLAQLETGPTGGLLVHPPHSAAGRVRSPLQRRALNVIGFWVALTGIVALQSTWLAAHGDITTRKLLLATFALVTLVGMFQQAAIAIWALHGAKNALPA